MSAAPIYIPHRFSKPALQSQGLHDTLVGAALGVALAGAAFCFAELLHHSGYNPYLADEPAMSGESA